jgi:hypothetical protein
MLGPAPIHMAVLDRLLEEERLCFEGITASSAGSVNAAAPRRARAGFRESLRFSQDPKQTWSVGSYLGPLLASFFLISGLSYKTTFSRDLLISSFPLYWI